MLPCLIMCSDGFQQKKIRLVSETHNDSASDLREGSSVYKDQYIPDIVIGKFVQVGYGRPLLNFVDFKKQKRLCLFLSLVIANNQDKNCFHFSLNCVVQYLLLSLT